MGASGKQAGELRWGILGTADIAPRVIAAIRATGCGVVAAVASRDGRHARSWADAHAIPAAYGSYEALLASGDIDLVYVPLPHSLHAEWSIRCLEAGLPVLCEKPLATSAADARRVADAARRAGLPAAEAFMYRFHPLYDSVLAALRAGRIGRPTVIRSQFTFALDDPDAIVASAELGGGALMDVGCYCVNVARLLAGAEPLRAMAFARREGVDRTLCGLLELPGGVAAQIECSIESHERHSAEIAGTEGTLVIESPWFPGDDTSRFVIHRDGAADEVVLAPGGDGYQLEVRDFARACTTSQPPRWPLEDAVANMAAIEALLESARTGRAVAVCSPA